jgi:hypothetical protein
VSGQNGTAMHEVFTGSNAFDWAQFNSLMTALKEFGGRTLFVQEANDDRRYA